MAAYKVLLVQICLKMDVSCDRFLLGISWKTWQEAQQDNPHREKSMFFGCGIEINSHELWEDLIPLMSTKRFCYGSTLGPWRPAWESSQHWLCSSCWMWCPPKGRGQGSQQNARPPPGGPLSSNLLDRNSQSLQSPRTSLRSSWGPRLCTPTVLWSVYALPVIQTLSTVRTGTSVWSLRSHPGPTTCTCRTTS